MIKEKLAAILRQHFPKAEALDLYTAAEDIEFFIIGTYGPPF